MAGQYFNMTCHIQDREIKTQAPHLWDLQLKFTTSVTVKENTLLVTIQGSACGSARFALGSRGRGLGPKYSECPAVGRIKTRMMMSKKCILYGKGKGLYREVE